MIRQTVSFLTILAALLATAAPAAASVLPPAPAGAWYADAGARVRSAPHALMTRYNPDQTADDDWILLPWIETPGTHETILSFWGRARINTFTETVEVLIAEGTSRRTLTPADFTLIDTIVTNSDNHQQYQYTLPANSQVRVALRYVSEFRSQFIADDFAIILGEAIAVPYPGGFNDDGGVDLADFFLPAGARGTTYQFSDFLDMAGNWGTCAE